MLSVKRLMQIIVILLVISVAFLMFNVSNTLQKSTNNNIYAELNVPLTVHKMPQTQVAEKYIVVGNAKDDTERAIQSNITSALSNMKLPYQVRNKIDEKNLTGKPTVIFTSARISGCASLPWVGDYINSGGKVMFTAGIPENDEDSYLNPVWGIVEKGSRFQTKSFHIMNNFLPYGEISADYGGYNVSTNLHLSRTVQVLMESENEIPVVYRNSYNTGKVVIINGTLLDSKCSMGIFCAALGQLQEELIYPVLGTKSVYLDGFPPLSNANDRNSFALYGRSVEAFVRDLLWPELLSSQRKYELKYTASILGVIPKKQDINLSNKRLLIYLGKQIIQNSGEIGISGDHSKKFNTAKEQAKELNDYLKSDFVNYQFNTYSILYGKADLQTLNGLNEELDKFTVLRGVYWGNTKTQQIQKFGVENGFITFPTVTSGFNEDGGTLFHYLCALSEHGVVSHSFNIEDLAFGQAKDSDWNKLKDSYYQMNKDFFSNTFWLKAATLSEAAQNAKAYDSLQMVVQHTQRGLKVNCSQFMKNQTFFLRSNRAVKQVVGGSFVKINDVYYMVTAENPEFTIVYE